MRGWNAVIRTYCFAGFGTGDDAKDFPETVFHLGAGLASRTAMDTDRNLATSAQGSQRGTLRSNGKSGSGIVKKSKSGKGGWIVQAGFDAKRALPCRRAENFGF